LVVAELTGPPPARGSPRASEKRVTADGRSQRSSLATLSAMTFTTKLGSPSAAARTYASVKTRPRSVLDPTRDSIRTAYFWLYLGDGDHGYIVYDYRDSRCRGGPAEMLMDFPGYLQTDAYASDESAVEESGGRIIPVGGWTHPRRAFFDARLNEPRGAHRLQGLVGRAVRHRSLQGPEARSAGSPARPRCEGMVSPVAPGLAVKTMDHAGQKRLAAS
jgi:Transposase IS66 family